MPDSKVEVKACPFCGSQAIYKIEQPRMDSDNLPKYCKCSNGPCCASKIFWPIEQWNTRSPIANNGVSVEDIKKVLYKDCIGRCIAPNAEGYEYRSHPDKLAEALTKLQPTAINNGVSLHEITELVSALEDMINYYKPHNWVSTETGYEVLNKAQKVLSRLPTTAPRGGDPLNILKRIIKATPHSMCSDAEAWAIAEQLITEGDVIGG